MIIHFRDMLRHIIKRCVIFRSCIMFYFVAVREFVEKKKFSLALGEFFFFFQLSKNCKSMYNNDNVKSRIVV